MSIRFLCLFLVFYAFLGGTRWELGLGCGNLGEDAILIGGVWNFGQVPVPGAVSGGQCRVCEISGYSAFPVRDRREQGNLFSPCLFLYFLLFSNNYAIFHFNSVSLMSIIAYGVRKFSLHVNIGCSVKFL